MERRAFLKEIDIFSGLSEAELDRLASIGTEETFAKGDTVFREHEPGTKLYLVQSGTVDIGKSGEGGRFTRLARLERGEVFGELAMLDERPRSATAVAAIAPELKLLSFERKAFEKLLTDDPLLAARIYRGMLRKVAARLRLADEAIQTLLRSLNYTGF
ncbi:MAG: cyclic nucleotide-binding domain-containing protein [Planctomycetes bacterium]|nr:cyclic nucleotide-binding domain-containing protein [Planctomycetota bacterium]